ncbi:hypothetical protein Neosp_010019 [[Neocosmospora] mangrovei]
MATVNVAGGPIKRDISELARICERLFLKYTDPELERTKDRTRAEIQLQRFNVWASYLGVFAEDNASLDRRLEHSDEIQNLVLQLLLLLQENLKFINLDEDDCPKTESELILDGTVSEALDTVEATIDRLNRLGSTIRKYSTSSLDSRVKAFTESFLAPTSANTKASTFKQTPSLVAKLQTSHRTSVVSSSKQSTTFMTEDLDNYPDPPKKEAGKPEPTYSEIWAHHMREAHSAKWTQLIHKPFVWRCDVGHLEKVGEFADEKNFEEHLDSQHRDCSPAARKAISSACKVFQKRERNLCPLCSYDVSAPEPGEASVSAEAKPKVDRAAQLGKLAKHIAGHLRRLAFDSSRNLDCVSEEDDASQMSIETSNPIERDGSKTHPPSGLKDLLEVSLGFIDDIETQRNDLTAADHNAPYDVEYLDYAPGSSPPDQEDLNWVQSWTLWRDNNDALCEQPGDADHIIEHFKVKSIQGTSEGVDALFDLCVNVFSLFSNYSYVAKDDVQRLQRTLDMLNMTLEDAQLFLVSPNNSTFGTSQSVRDGLNGCSSQLKDLKSRLETQVLSGTDGVAAQLHATTLQWPFESKDVDSIVMTLDQYRETLSPTVGINPRFQRPLQRFKQGLRKGDQESFKNTTDETVLTSLEILKARQSAKGRLPRLSKLQPFLDALRLYGEAIQLFCKSSEIMAFIWVLVLIYEDIIKFHQIALGHFQTPHWEELFDLAWNSCKTRLLDIISEIARRGSEFEKQAHLSLAEDIQVPRPTDYSSLDIELRKRDFRRRSLICDWLGATNPEADQDHLARIRVDHPGTGRWLFDNPSFREWFDPQYPAIPPLLWIKGSPGTGKSILASLVVEQAQKLNSPGVVLFFYCKHGHPEKNSFDALARSFLLQLLQKDKGLLTCEGAYIVIDGLDECGRDERKVITQWFRRLVESLPHSDPDRLRCLFVSQDDGVARKDLRDIASINIVAEGNKNDIHQYSIAMASKLKDKFELSVEEAGKFATFVADAAQGLFLLAKLVWANLLRQTSIAGVEAQLGDNFPSGINEAYERIMDRIVQQASPEEMEDISSLLGWLVCAKRSLKWHEIQILKSINLDKRSVEFERNRFRVDAKDLFESLVEIQPDGTLEFAHTTAKFFLVGNNRYVDATAKELEIACRCIDYLSLPAFELQPTEDRALKGEYGFMDYAVLYWIRHLEAGTEQCNGYEGLVKELAESLETFIRQYWKGPTSTLPVSGRTKKRLQCFQELSFYENLEQAVESSKKQLRTFGEMRKGQMALNLADAVNQVRTALERLASPDSEPSVQRNVEEIYGRNLFKCSRFSCKFFTTGFPTADDRDKHMAKHTRPFQCPEEFCTGSLFGFSSEAERDKHMKNTHFTATMNDLEFPTDEEVARSIRANMAEEEAGREPTGSSESEPETEQHQSRMRKGTKQAEFQCPHCSKVYKKKYNLESHVRTHARERPYVCLDCGDAFAQASDYNRHTRKHTGAREFVCSGVLQNGASWGCGRAFSRADTLNTHWKSELGKVCRLPFLQEQEQQEEESHQE